MWRCILIIVRALKDDEIKALHEAAGLAGLDAIYEIHEARELERARPPARVGQGCSAASVHYLGSVVEISSPVVPSLPMSSTALNR